MSEEKTGSKSYEAAVFRAGEIVNSDLVVNDNGAAVIVKFSVFFFAFGMAVYQFLQDNLPEFLVYFHETIKHVLWVGVGFMIFLAGFGKMLFRSKQHHVDMQINGYDLLKSVKGEDRYWIHKIGSSEVNPLPCEVKSSDWRVMLSFLFGSRWK